MGSRPSIEEYEENSKNISYQDDGVNRLYFRYNEEGSLSAFEWNGNEYIYIKSIQEDVIGIANMNGNQIASYTYDDWKTPGWLDGDEALANVSYACRC